MVKTTTMKTMLMRLTPCIKAHDREEHIARMINVCKKALVNIGIAQERQKKYYNTKYKTNYKIGTLVLLKNSKKLTRKGSKLEPNWTGPYRIKEVLSKGTFRLCNANDSEKILTSLYNMTRLKSYYDAESSSATKQASGISPSYQKDTGISANYLNSSHVNSSPPHLIVNSPVKGSKSPTQQLFPEPVLIQQPPATCPLPQESCKVEQVQFVLLWMYSICIQRAHFMSMAIGMFVF